MEEYDDDPDAYIRNDLEESEAETRRRYCMKFVQKLSRKFPNEVAGIVNNFVNTFQQEYMANREQQWPKKCSLLNLLITSSISSYTFRGGASEINISPETLFSYIEQLIFPELQEQEIDNLPILKATCLKFLYMFRN